MAQAGPSARVFRANVKEGLILMRLLARLGGKGAFMRLFILSVITMCGFAANSVLTRVALEAGLIDAASFGLVRLFSGAVVLAGLVSVRASAVTWRPRSWFEPLALLGYVVGFSIGYVTLPAGLGAFILFGGVQVTMLAFAVLLGQNVTRTQGIGMAVASVGLVLLFDPFGQGDVDGWGAVAMSCAAVSWGAYSFLGKGAGDPLQSSARNFLFAFLGAVPVLIWFVDRDAIQQEGVLLAILSGGFTSALVYALWYWILPQIQTMTAAIAQLSVPVLATLFGVVFMGEVVGVHFLLAAFLILFGIVISVLSPAKGS